MTNNTYSIIIENGTIIDGSGKPGYKCDIGIVDGIIKTIGSLHNSVADTRIDAANMLVCPGFVDSHCHTDIGYAAEFPGVQGKIMQGVTTDVCGLCSTSYAPVGEGNLQEFLKRQKDVLGGIRKSMTVKEYIEETNQRGNSTNIAMFAGNANIRIHGVGYENREATEEEMVKMKDLLKHAMEDGAFGLSTGLTYVPSQFASTEELIELCKIIVPFGGMYNSHMRNEGNEVVKSVAEVIEIAEKSGCKGHCSHLKAAGSKNHGKVKECLKLINEANQRGVNVTFDVYPYTAGSISLSAVLPQWVLSQGFGDNFEVLKDPKIIKRIEEDLTREDWENVVLQCGFNKIHIGFAENLPQYEGKSITQIANELNTTELDAMLKVLIDSKAQATIIYYIVSEDDLRLLMQSPYCSIGTDAFARDYSGPTTSGKPHPRNFGGIPRFIKKYVLDEKLMSIEEGIYKITGLPARMFNLPNRGIIQEKMVADITIFNPTILEDTCTYTNPACKPKGIEYVIIDGKIAVNKGVFNDIRAGKALKLDK